MCFLFKKYVVILELVQTASGKHSDVLMRQTHFRACSDAKKGQSIGHAFLPWEMHSPLFRVFCAQHLNWTNSMPASCSCADHD